ncbi:MAG: response regulator transcription factor [Gloeomargaritaceae cyanobacterium C42_A2020_066]|nr:response regulator transcription factor [Gloeomargaritaceae cyanobacterium C42_A2020_066]
MSAVTDRSSRTGVLVVEPDASLAERLAVDLRSAGYHPLLVADPQAALLEVLHQEPALVVIDRMFTGDQGLALCQALRHQGSQMPILLMMAQDTVEDRIACLEAGAHDYFLKPYQSAAFLHRVQLYLEPPLPTTEQLHFADLTLNLDTRTALRGGRTIHLTMKEFDLLRYLMENPLRPLSREEILEHVWGYDYVGESNVIEVYVRYLRLKLDQPGEKHLIQTVRGVGYVLRET